MQLTPSEFVVYIMLGIVVLMLGGLVVAIGFHFLTRAYARLMRFIFGEGSPRL